jgi:tetratricopeptide (TPR) repeat protein
LRRGLSLILLASLILTSGAISRADETADFRLGNDLAAEGKFDQARAAYGSFSEQHPDHRLAAAALWNMAGISMTVLEDHQRAAELFEVIIDRYPDSEWAIFAGRRLGLCREAGEMWTGAAEAYQPVVRWFSTADHPPVTEAWMGELKRSLLTSYRNAGQHDRIIGMYEEILAENPAAPSAPEDQFQLAEAFLETGDDLEAAENFALLLVRYPASSYARRVQDERADLLTGQLNYDWESFSAFRSGQDLSRAGRSDQAMARFDEVIGSAPPAMARAAVFQKHLAEYRLSGDAAALRRAIAAERGRDEYGFGGMPVDRLGEALRSICQAQAQLESNPGDAAAYQQMGIGYYRTQAYQCGMDAYRQAITIDPQNTMAHNMLGYCCISAGRFEEAVSAFHQLVEAAPEDPNSYDSLAEGYYQLGDTTRAIEYYRQALTVDSTFSNPYFMLGTIYREQSRRDEAIAHLERYLELDPGGYQSPGARAQLEGLRRPEEE